MSVVFVSLGMTVDGYIAGPNGGPDNPLGDRGPTIHTWMYGQRAFRSRFGMAGGDTGRDDQILEATMTRSGATIMGKRMFEEGEKNWPEEAPFHMPVFVLTHQVRSPWQRPGGTTFHFVDDGIESALERARDAAGGKDIRIAGGADLIRQYLHAGLIDELHIALAPILLGDGVRLFDGIDPVRVSFEIAEAVHSPSVTHLRYSVKRPRR
jgi:dihydrofolate reductase